MPKRWQKSVSNSLGTSSQAADLLRVRDRGARACRVCKEIERHLLVVSDRRECGVLICSGGWIAHDDRLEHQEAYDRSDDNGMFAERLPHEPRPEDEEVLSRQS